MHIKLTVCFKSCKVIKYSSSYIRNNDEIKITFTMSYLFFFILRLLCTFKLYFFIICATANRKHLQVSFDNPLENIKNFQLALLFLKAKSFVCK